MRPVSYMILIIIVIVFFTKMNMYDSNNEIVNYILRSFYHANMSHLIANGISFYNLSFIEDVLGSVKFLIAMIFIWIISSLLLYVYHHFFPSRKVLTVGFSGVIFGLFVVYYSMIGDGAGFTVGRLIISIVPQLVVPGISWEGHICGIIAGVLYVLLFPKIPKISPRGNL